jgi:dephospho-CoA kinase
VVSLPARRLILGLLGPVAVGKSFVARRIAALGPGTVLDADAMAHEALDAAASDGRLEAALGPGFVRADGRADRDALRARVQQDARRPQPVPAGSAAGVPGGTGADRAEPRARAATAPSTLATLEGLTHPAVRARLEQAVARHRAGEGPPVLVLDVPLLLEAGLEGLCDELWLVEADEGARRERARGRGLAAQDLAGWERMQASPAARRAAARQVIKNDVPPDALDRQLRAALAGTPA